MEGYPIPKLYDWNYSIAATRPIILIECTRKVITKIIGNRLSQIISNHNILRGPNFAGLKDEDTSTPIHIVNGLIEEAKENSEELWLIFQDMAKAYDSIGLIPLKFALKRIKILENIINFIISLFYKRQIRIITSYGLSEPFTGEDGIDQGKTISPLLWRIFYDPLLSKIQQDHNLGYSIQVKWPSCIANKNRSVLSHRTAASAYLHG